jgi:hypothetical protein
MKKVIGRREKINLPDWDLWGISGKVDTGAYTSSIHSEYAEMIKKGDKSYLRFTVLDRRHPKYTGNVIETDDFTVKSVKNSFGEAQNRYQIVTTIELFGEKFDTEFTLSDRSRMRNQILLGRKTLRGRFIVDVDLTDQSKKMAKLASNRQLGKSGG